MPQRRRRRLLKVSRQLQNTSIRLLSQNVAEFLKHPEHCSSWFSHFPQSEYRGSIDFVLLQEMRVTIGEYMTMEMLFNASWGFGHKRGRSLWT